MKKKKFKNIWKNQTELGKLFGLSSVKIGKVLIEKGLKDKETKRATEKALKEEYAVFTPLKDGSPFYLWNIKKCKNLISTEIKPINQIDIYANDIKKKCKEIDKMLDRGEDKLGYMMLDCIYDEVPDSIKDQVKNKVDEFLKKNKLLWFDE